MLTDLIIDGNFVLSKLVFTLHKNNILYGALNQALANTISGYRKLYPFTNVYLVSDSKEKSWRKKLTQNYKGTRKKDTDIDWPFVYIAYGEFKESLKGARVLEYPHIEGDDWISHIVEDSNSKGRSTMIISNDYDIKQLIKYSIDPLWINMMSNEMYNKEKIFLPENYQIFMNKIESLPNDNIFNMNDNFTFITLIKRLLNQYSLHEVNYVESLVIKLISGDKSDNIDSVWVQTNKNGKKRGIGEKGAQSIYGQYKEEFGEADIDDVDLFENLADLICEKKKISKQKIDIIVDNIKDNSKLIDLRTDKLPVEISNKMKEIFNK